MDTEDVRRAGPAQRFDDMIGLGPGFDHEIATNVLGGLVMHRVGLGQADAWIQLRQPGARHDRRCVGVAGIDVPVAMIQRRGQLCREVLEERASECDIDDLRAAAHAEHRLRLVHECAQ